MTKSKKKEAFELFFHIALTQIQKQKLVIDCRQFIHQPLLAKFNPNLFNRLCMKHIEIAMSKLNLEQEVDSEHISIVEQILRETRNPKIAAVLALDLMLVGVDTVSSKQLNLET